MEKERLVLLQDIERRMKLNIKDYKIYVELGDYYISDNINKAYLCYEHSLVYCNNEEDINKIKKVIEEIKEHKEFNVRQTSIVILIYSTKNHISNCLDSIRNSCYETEYEIVVVDNNIDNDTIEYLKNQEDITLILNDFDKGYPAGYNQGLEASKDSNDILLLDDNTIMYPNTLFWLRMGIYDNNDIGACGCVTNYGPNEQIAYVPKDDEKEYKRLIEINNSKIINEYEPKLWLAGFAMLVKREVFNLVGNFDERYTPGVFEDIDYGVRIYRAGYKQYVCHNSYIEHVENSGVGKDSVKYKNVIEENYKKFSEKWGMTYDEYMKLSRIEYKGKIFDDSDINNLKRVISEKRQADFWRLVYRNDIKRDIEKYSDLIKKGDKDSLERIYECIYREGYVSKYREHPDLVELIVFISIYEKEKANGIDNHIFSKGYSLEQIKAIYAELKYAIWRMMYIDNSCAVEDIVQMINKYEISYEYMDALVKTSAMNNVEAYYMLGYALRRYGHDITAIKLYNAALEIEGNNEYILCELADIFLEYGKKDVAMNYINLIDKYTECSEKYLLKWEEHNGK